MSEQVPPGEPVNQQAGGWTPPPQPPGAQPPGPSPAAEPPAYTWEQPSARAPQAAAQPQSWQQPAEVGPAPGIRFAGYGARLVAYIVDGLILGAAVVVVSIVLALVAAGLVNAGSDAGAATTILIWTVVLLVITLAYFPYYWSHGGQTIGQRMMRVRVVRDIDGGPLTVGQAVIRLIGLWVAGAVLYLGYIWVFVDPRRRGWHDLIAGTVVIEA